MAGVHYGWDRQSKTNILMLDVLADRVRKAAELSAHESAVDYQETVKTYIETQMGASSYEPLSRVWSEMKRIRNLDPRFHIATGEYLNSFTVHKMSMEGRVSCLAYLGVVLEYGGVSSTGQPIPPRPHQMPALELSLPTVRGRVRRNLRNALALR